MRHSGNYGTIISTKYLLNGVEQKIYVYDELDRFVTVATILYSTDDLRLYQDGIAEQRERHRQEAQIPLPPWQ